MKYRVFCQVCDGKCSRKRGILTLFIFLEIESFLSARPKEIVILDFQHLYQFRCVDHNILLKLLVETFQEKICPRPKDLGQLTLEKMFKDGHQVIVIYPVVDSSSDLLWPRCSCPTPWPNTTSATKLEKFLDNGLSKKIGTTKQIIIFYLN